MSSFIEGIERRQALVLLRDIVFAYVALNTTYQLGTALYHRGVSGVFTDCGRWIKLRLFQWLRRIPAADAIIQAELDKVIEDMEEKILQHAEHLPSVTSLPATGLSTAELHQLMEAYAGMDDADIEGGKVSGTVYSGDVRLKKVILQAYNRFLYSNPLHPDVFKGVRKMEAEVVAMTLGMYAGRPNDVDGCVGTMTTGGTESILLACKAYRDQARLERGIVFPEIVAPVTAHAAFDKAAQYFGIRLVHARIDRTTGRADLSDMRALITPNTVALVGSAPNFAFGVMDDIEAIAALAAEHGIGCHVDCCLGSFLLPYLDTLGRAAIRPFAFDVPGVTSISCDPHKYGYAPKGSSVIMYRSAALRHYQYFVATEWTGGIYATPTLLGSRSGATIAATWATMMAMGEDGYRQAAIQIQLVVDRICDGIRHIEDFFVFGEPASSVVAFGSTILNIYAVNDEMSRRGWHLNALQNPPAVHLACTRFTSERTVELFLQDLAEAGTVVKERRPGDERPSGTAVIYGTSASIPDKSLVEDVAKAYMDILYKP